jgi:hypothetical protein
VNSIPHNLQNKKAAAAIGVADDGKLKQACDRIVAASRFVVISAAAVITRKIDGGGNAPNRTIHCDGR